MTEGLSDRIKEARDRNGWSQKQVASWAGVTAPQLCRWEAGTDTPGTASLAKLARGLRVSSDWLLGLEEA